MNSTDWNDTIAALPHPHLLQTAEWGRLKSFFSWRPHQLTWDGADQGVRASGSAPGTRISMARPAAPNGGPDAGTAAKDAGTATAAAQMLVRQIPIGGFAARVSLAYVPKGPNLDWADAGLRRQVLSDLIRAARKQGALLLKIDPEVLVGTGEPGSAGAEADPVGETVIRELQANGWVRPESQAQYANTVTVDLTPDEETLLANMKQKTRYNIRLAGRRGVTVRTGSPADFDLLFRMYAETSKRDGFVIREGAYYSRLWEIFHAAGMLDPLIAEVEGAPVAAVVILRFAGTAIYLHGMSTEQHREKMPNYLLQWEAMRQAKAAGCAVYDMWGAPERFDESDSMWGVYRFKDGFGGQVRRHVGEWDYPVRPLLYRLYVQVLPRILGFMRARAGGGAEF